MKMKRFLSLLLALVMSLSMAVPAFAAEPDDPDEGIMPLMQLFENPSVNDSTGSYRTDSFTSTPGNGKYIKVWYRNSSSQAATVYLYREGKAGAVDSVRVLPNSDPGEIWYVGSDTEPVTYYVRIVQDLNAPVAGYLAVGQKTSK